MAYAPNPLTHLALSDRADLFCSPCGQYCSEQNPCLCDTEALPSPEGLKSKARAKQEPETRLVEDSDTGVAGDSHG